MNKEQNNYAALNGEDVLARFRALVFEVGCWPRWEGKQVNVNPLAVAYEPV